MQATQIWDSGNTIIYTVSDTRGSANVFGRLDRLPGASFALDLLSGAYGIFFDSTFIKLTRA